MSNTKSHELMEAFIKAKAEKYKALDERNKYVESRIFDGYNPTLEELNEVTDKFNNCSMNALEGEYRLINFLNCLKVYELNSFYDLVKRYSNERETEMKKLSTCLLPDRIEEESCKKLEYYEKYERPSIKDLLFMIVRQKGKWFGMTDEEAYLYAGREMRNLIDIDVLTIELEDLKELERVRKKD